MSKLQVICLLMYLVVLVRGEVTLNAAPNTAKQAGQQAETMDLNQATTAASSFKPSTQKIDGGALIIGLPPLNVQELQQLLAQKLNVLELPGKKPIKKPTKPETTVNMTANSVPAAVSNMAETPKKPTQLVTPLHVHHHYYAHPYMGAPPTPFPSSFYPMPYQQADRSPFNFYYPLQQANSFYPPIYPQAETAAYPGHYPLFSSSGSRFYPN